MNNEYTMNGMNTDITGNNNNNNIATNGTGFDLTELTKILANSEDNLQHIKITLSEKTINDIRSTLIEAVINFMNQLDDNIDKRNKNKK